MANTRVGRAKEHHSGGHQRALQAHAVRYRRGHADDGQLELLAAALPADESYDPLHVLEADLSPSDTNPDAQLSQASAWLFLVDRSGNEMRRLADRLLISVSHCYHCLARARSLARRQHALAIRCTGRDDIPVLPKGWRRFRYERRPIQLQFAFLMEPTLWQENAAGSD